MILVGVWLVKGILDNWVWSMVKRGCGKNFFMSMDGFLVIVVKSYGFYAFLFNLMFWENF